MTKIPAIIAFLIATALAGTAFAQDFPNWPSRLTCKSGDSSCARFETFARGQISGTWKTLPPGARTICVIETEKVEKSYRLLQDCLTNVMQSLLANQQRNPPSGDVVQLTPKAKVKKPLPVPQAGPEPAAQAIPASPAPVPQAGPATTPEPVAERAPQPVQPAPMAAPESPAAPPAPPQ